MGRDKDTAITWESQPEPFKFIFPFGKVYFPVETFSSPTLAFIMDATLHLYSKAEIIFVWSNLLTKGHCAVLKTKHSIFIQALSLHTWRKKILCLP